MFQGKNWMGGGMQIETKIHQMKWGEGRLKGL